MECNSHDQTCLLDQDYKLPLHARDLLLVVDNQGRVWALRYCIANRQNSACATQTGSAETCVSGVGVPAGFVLEPAGAGAQLDARRWRTSRGLAC